MPFSRPNLNEIIERVETDITSRTSENEYPQAGSVAGVFAAALGGASHLLHAHLDWGIKQMLPSTATGEQLEEHARIWLKVPRKPAAFAEGEITVTGAPGAVLPAGTLFARGDGIRFVTTADLTLSASSGAVTVAAETAGEIGNTKAGTVFTMVSPVLGIQSSAPVGLSGISGGSDVESDADLRSRLIRRIQGSAQGGADYDYETWALEVPGITRAWVLPLHNGLGTVSVAVVRDNDESIIPDEREIARVQEHIEEVRPVTARVTVIAPVEKKVQYRINLAPDTAENRAGVEAALKSFHLRESSMGGTLYLSRISEAISLAPNEFMHVMSEPAKDVTCAPNEILTFGGVVWPS